MLVYAILILVIALLTLNNNVYKSYVYLDNNATTKPNNSAIFEFNKCLFLGNASAHYGHKARRIIERTRNTILKCAELDPKEYIVILTSGASESINMFINTLMLDDPNRRIQTSSYEHKTTMDCLEKYSSKTTYISPNEYGEISSKSFTPMDNLVVTLIMAHNEYGSVNYIDKHDLPPCIYHVDVVQGFGKYPLPRADAYTISFHKLNGFQGCGALIIHYSLYEIFKSRAQICGTQNYNTRGGTENIPLIASIHGALIEKFTDRSIKNTLLLDKKEYILNNLSRYYRIFDYRSEHVLGPVQLTVINLNSINTIYLCVLFVGIPQICGKYLCSKLYDDYKIIVSTGSACNTSNINKHTFIPDILKISGIRISLGDDTRYSDCRKFVLAYSSILDRHMEMYGKN